MFIHPATNHFTCRLLAKPSVQAVSPGKVQLGIFRGLPKGQGQRNTETANPPSQLLIEANADKELVSREMTLLPFPLARTILANPGIYQRSSSPIHAYSPPPLWTALSLKRHLDPSHCQKMLLMLSRCSCSGYTLATLTVIRLPVLPDPWKRGDMVGCREHQDYVMRHIIKIGQYRRIRPGMILAIYNGSPSGRSFVNRLSTNFGLIFRMDFRGFRRKVH